MGCERLLLDVGQVGPHHVGAQRPGDLPRHAPHRFRLIQRGAHRLRDVEQGLGLPQSHLGLLEEPGLVDGDRGMGRDAAGQRDLLGRERRRCIPGVCTPSAPITRPPLTMGTSSMARTPRTSVRAGAVARSRPRLVQHHRVLGAQGAAATAGKRAASRRTRNAGDARRAGRPPPGGRAIWSTGSSRKSRHWLRPSRSAVVRTTVPSTLVQLLDALDGLGEPQQGGRDLGLLPLGREQPRVIDGQGGLRGQSAQELDLLERELPRLAVQELQDARASVP